MVIDINSARKTQTTSILLILPMESIAFLKSFRLNISITSRFHVVQGTTQIKQKV